VRIIVDSVERPDSHNLLRNRRGGLASELLGHLTPHVSCQEGLASLARHLIDAEKTHAVD